MPEGLAGGGPPAEPWRKGGAVCVGASRCCLGSKQGSVIAAPVNQTPHWFCKTGGRLLCSTRGQSRLLPLPGHHLTSEGQSSVLPLGGASAAGAWQCPWRLSGGKDVRAAMSAGGVLRVSINECPPPVDFQGS